MSKISASRCDNCGNQELSPNTFPGWIQISDLGLSISGNISSDGLPMTERFSENIKTYPNRTLDFCCAKCFLQWIYLSPKTQNHKDKEAIGPFYEMIRDEIGIFKPVV